jgi:hypothetical protein
MPPSQGWKTFLHNHADGIGSMDLFLVPTISFRLLYGLLILRHARRELLWVGVTAHPSAESIVGQLTEPYGWQQAPASSHGHTRSTDRTTVTMAERMCREAARIDPAGLP